MHAPALRPRGRLIPCRYLAAGLFVAWTPGCGALVGNPSTGKANPPKGAIHFELTDAPSDKATSLFVSFKSLALGKSRGDGTTDWQDLPLTVPTTVDVLKWRGGATTPLAEALDADAGSYESVRIAFDPQVPPTILLPDGTNQPVEMSSGAVDAIELMREVIVEPGVETKLIIDFDVRKSLSSGQGIGDKESAKALVDTEVEAASNTFTLSPQLRIFSEYEVGSLPVPPAVGGKVACVYAVGAVKDENSGCANAVTSDVLTADVENSVPFVPAGRYEVRVFDANDAVVADIPAAEVKVAGGPKSSGNSVRSGRIGDAMTLHNDAEVRKSGDHQSHGKHGKSPTNTDSEHVESVAPAPAEQWTDEPKHSTDTGRDEQRTAEKSDQSGAHHRNDGGNKDKRPEGVNGRPGHKR